MYRIRATAGARRLAKVVSKRTGVPWAHIIVEARSAANRQVQRSDVEQWWVQFLRRSEKKNTSAPQRSMLSIDYPAVQAWGDYLRSSPAYIAAQLELAAQDYAPGLAVYRVGRKWVTLPNVKAPPARFFFEKHYPELAEQAWGVNVSAGERT